MYGEGKKQSMKRQHWSKEEDQILESCCSIYGPKWSLIAQNLPNRDAHSIRNRFTRNKMFGKVDSSADIDLNEGILSREHP